MTENVTADAATDTWEVWGSTDPGQDPMPIELDITRDAAITRVDELLAQGHPNVYATNYDETYDGPTVTVDGFESLLNLPSVLKYRDGEDGRLVAIDYRHDPIYPQLSGPLLHFQLPSGTVVVTVPDGDGSFDLAWKDGPIASDIDEGAREVLHMMRGEIVAAFDRLTRRFLSAAVTSAAQAFTNPTGGAR